MNREGDGLAAAMSRLLVAFTIELDNEFEQHMPHRTAAFGPGGPEPVLPTSGRPFRPPWLASLAMWQNGLRYVPRDGLPRARLEGLGANLAGLQRWGYLRAVVTQDGAARPGGPEEDGPQLGGPEPHGPGLGEEAAGAASQAGEVLRPTAAGRYAQVVWSRLEDVIERRWDERYGPDLVAALRAALAGLAGEDDATAPLYLPMVSQATGMRTRYRAPSPDLLAVAGVPGPSGPGLDTLLARALLRFTTDFEAESDVSLPLAADLLAGLTDRAIPMRYVPALGGVSKEAVQSATGFLERHGLVVTGADPEASRGRAISLTGQGRIARDRYGRTWRQVERQWEDRFGTGVVGGLRSVLAAFAGHRTGGEPTLVLGLRPYGNGWRARGPYRARTRAVLADPWSALPRQPMILHRGGYPDGS